MECHSPTSAGPAPSQAIQAWKPQSDGCHGLFVDLGFYGVGKNTRDLSFMRPSTSFKYLKPKQSPLTGERTKSVMIEGFRHRIPCSTAHFVLLLLY